MKLKNFIVIVVGITCMILLSGCTQQTIPNNGNEETIIPPPLSLKSIDISPDHPVSGDILNVTVVATNSTSCRLEQLSFLNGVSSGGDMSRLSSDGYCQEITTIRTLPDVKWITIIALQNTTDKVVDTGTLIPLNVTLNTTIPITVTPDSVSADEPIHFNVLVGTETMPTSVCVYYVVVTNQSSGHGGNCLSHTENWNTGLMFEGDILPMVDGQQSLHSATVYYRALVEFSSAHMWDVAVSPVQQLTIP